MKPQKIKAIFDDQIGDMRDYGKKINHDFEKDHIHNFRVGLKTFRAFLRFLQTTRQGCELKIPKNVNRLYHISGTLRDAQLELQDIHDQQVSLQEYEQKLHEIIKTQKKEWDKHCAKSIFKKMEKRFGNCEYSAVHTSELAAFFKTKQQSMSSMAKIPSPGDDQIHQMRKDAKDIIYISDIATLYWTKSYAVLAEVPAKQLDELSDKIGSYHDEVVRIGHMSLFSSPKMTLEEKSAIDSICQQKRATLSEQKREILEIASVLDTQGSLTVPALY